MGDLGVKTKIFVDGNCIVCDTEISHYKKMAPELFEIVDISRPDFNAAEFGFTAEDVNLKMHLLTPDHQVKTGVDAFAYIWSQMDYYKWASKVIQLPGVNQLAKIGYRIFAANRHLLPKRNKGKL